MTDRSNIHDLALRWSTTSALLVLALTATPPARAAQLPAETARPSAAERLPEAEPVDAMPVADSVSGVLVPETVEAPRWVWIPRALLFPLRIAAQIGFAPLRGAAWASDRYRLRDRIAQLLFNDDGTFGIYPIALFATGLGLNVGARLVARDLAGSGERLSLDAGYGGELNQRYDASLSSGARLGAAVATAHASFRVWNHYNDYGIGNDTAGVQTQFAQHVWYAEIAVRRQLAGPLAFQLVAAHAVRNLDGPGASVRVDRRPDAAGPGAQVGLAPATHHVYGEVGLALDSTSYASRYLSRANPSAGWLARAFVGATEGLAGDSSHYLRYGFDVHRFLDLYRGDRVLVLHAALEGVTAPLDAIPFLDLPRLGGEALLRGFHDDRFRDRLAGLGSAEYRFPVQDGVTGFAFADAGQVASAVSRFELHAWHVGVGGGLQFQTRASFLFRLQVATSDDGTFFQLAFDPGRDVHARQRRL